MPDGHSALLGWSDGMLLLWNLESGQTLRTFEGHTAAVRGVAVTPDGRRAVSGSYDRTLRLWNLESGQEIAAFTADDMRSCAVAPDGRTIFGGDTCGTVHVLRLVEADKTKPAIDDTKIQLLHRKHQG
jgi:WD40 repeat protein